MPLSREKAAVAQFFGKIPPSGKKEPRAGELENRQNSP
jgi:hypothetical protein